MKRSLLWVLALSASLLAYSDSDMDGVEDTADRCPNTLMSELVNEQGCTIRSLQSDHHYDLIFGAGYSQLNYANNEKADTFTTTLQADYYYRQFSAQIISSYYASDSKISEDSGLNDTLIAAYYRMPITERFTIKAGGGVLLPTYESGYHNEAADYIGSLNLTYVLNPALSLIGGYNYTAVNDKNVPNVATYQNTNAFYAGADYRLSDALSVGGVYHNSDSIYRDVQNIQKVSAYGFYRFDTHWFGNLNYAYGLSDSASDHALDLRIGYYF